MSIRKARKVNLDKYIEGKWYEIASFPAWFQKGCENTTATYTKKDNFVEVLNACNVKGKEKKAKGKAFTTDKDNVLKVQFFFPFKSDYIIEYVDIKYEYAVVGSSGKKFLWILSKKKPIDKDILDKLVKFAFKKGYEVSKLEYK